MVVSDLTVQLTLLQMKTEEKKKNQAQVSHHMKPIPSKPTPEQPLTNVVW